jgi:probable phosphoglycerate mutase
VTPTIVFLRHGETDWNVEGRLQGQRDVPLNDNGRAQARRNGATLKRLVPGIAAFDFVASPLSRARETMEIVRQALGLAPGGYRTDDRLREATFGRWEGLTTEEIRAREPSQLAAREGNKWGIAPPGGESYERLATRVRPWLRDLAAATVVVAHGGIGRVLWIELVGLDPAQAVSIVVPHDRVFLWDGGGGRLL